MNLVVKNKFTILWEKYFNHAELPIIFYYTDEDGHGDLVKPGSVPRCVITALAKVREGHSLCFNVDSVGCEGGKRYLGFVKELRPNFEYFLSCGIPGKMEGERYKKSPELVKEAMKNWPTVEAPGRFVIFKRWDKLEAADNPEVVVFFATPDVLSGLFTLANFDQAEPNGVIAPFGSGCNSIVQYPFVEKNSPHPRAVLGMFDVSARPFVPSNTLTFAAPMSKFLTMIDNMEESFLITRSWAAVQKRIK
jgi:catechol 2,3-dioxygenase-like lactoylglutathione lyase family enzyme